MPPKKKVAEVKQGKGSFLGSFNEQCEDIDGISMSAPSPKYWLDTGSYVVNKVLSGSYVRGYPTGRLGALAGPSGAGKSFLLGNAIKSALNNKDVEWGVLVIDSENAIDNDYLEAIGANIHDNPFYNYRGVTTISQTLNIIQKFTKSYRSSNEDMPFLIAMDSIDMLQTDSENTRYEEDGEMGGDQGQHAKQIKGMLRRLVNDLKDLNVALVSTKQVYQEQDPVLAKQNPWKMTESFKFAFSQIGLVTKLLLKDDKTKKFEGITLKVFGTKTRFTKPFQQAKIEVPYDTGMDPYTGIVDAAVALGIVEKNGSWFNFDGQKFQSPTLEMNQAVFAKVVEKDSEVLNVEIEENEDTDEVLTAKEVTEKRRTREGLEE